MPDIETLTATLLANFTTVRIRRCETLWASRDPALPFAARPRAQAQATRSEILVAQCYRQCLRHRLVHAGYRAFIDHFEGSRGGEWRLHFFFLDRAAIAVLDNAGVGECGPGDWDAGRAEKFIERRLAALDRAGRLGRLDDWWWFFD